MILENILFEEEKKKRKRPEKLEPATDKDLHDVYNYRNKIRKYATRGGISGGTLAAILGYKYPRQLGKSTSKILSGISSSVLGGGTGALSGALVAATKNKKVKSEQSELIQQHKEFFPHVLKWAAIWTTMNLVLGYVIQKIMLHGAKLDKDKTKEIQKITEDDTVLVYKIPVSYANAFSDGTRKIYYTKGLISKLKLTEDEVMSLLLHEYGHYKENHVRKSTAVSFMSFFSFFIVWRHLSQHLPGNDIVQETLYPSLNVLISLAPILATTLTLGTHYENVADSYMSKFGYSKEAKSAFLKLDHYSRTSLCRMKEIKNKNDCNNLIAQIHTLDEHPVTKERLETLKNSFSSQVKEVIKHPIKYLKMYKNAF